MYVIDLATAKEASPLHVITKCVTNSYTFVNKPYLQPLCVVNPSYNRVVVDHRVGYVRGVID